MVRAAARPLNVDLTKTLTQTKEKRRLVPQIIAALSSKGFEDFSITIEGYKSGRGHDGWWHPSAHSLWTPRQLFLYLAYPDQVEFEKFGPESIKAVTVGKFWGEFYQHLLLSMGELVAFPNPPGMSPAEVPLSSAEMRLRGHADGCLVDRGDFVDELLELKSINEFQKDKITDWHILWDKKPGYFGQTQDYLLMHFGEPGVGSMRYLIVHPGYPFTEMEFVVPAHADYQRKRAKVYRDTWARAQEHQAGLSPELPRACCNIGSGLSKTCAVRFECSQGASI